MMIEQPMNSYVFVACDNCLERALQTGGGGEVRALPSFQGGGGGGAGESLPPLKSSGRKGQFFHFTMGDIGDMTILFASARVCSAS